MDSRLELRVSAKKTKILRETFEQKIPANVIVEFARVYGFQVDFQRDIRKRDSFQIMYEVFVDDNSNKYNNQQEEEWKTNFLFLSLTLLMHSLVLEQFS